MDHRPQIVVVEDEATQRQLLCDHLDKQNFRVSPADGGGALRRLLKRELPTPVLFRPRIERTRIDQTRIRPMGVEPKGFPKAPMQARYFSVRGLKAMTSNLICGAAALLLASAFVPAAAQYERIPEGHVQSPDADEVIPAVSAKVHPFAMMAGSWSGGGKIDLTNDIHEKLRCRATYAYNQSSSGLALAIRCASDNYKFELTSNVVERNGQISGQWSETAYGVSGSISGRVNGGRVSAVAKGDSFTAALSVNTNGNRQSVTITPQATYIINVQISMGKAAPAATAAR
jgi:hypothetical protein